MMMILRSALNNKGFSFTEVLIALLVFSIVSLSLFYVLAFAFKMKKEDQQRLLASKFADEQMIYLKNNKKSILHKINYKTIPSLKEIIEELNIKWKMNDHKAVTYRCITQIKIESVSPLLIHSWITVFWGQDDKERKYILESYL